MLNYTMLSEFVGINIQLFYFNILYIMHIVQTLNKHKTFFKFEKTQPNIFEGKASKDKCLVSHLCLCLFQGFRKKSMQH